MSYVGEVGTGSSMYWYVLIHTSMYWYVHVRTVYNGIYYHVYLCVPVHTSIYWYILVCTSMYLYVYVCTGTYQLVPGMY